VSESPEATPRIDVDALRHAIYAVSLRHDWANTTDTEDRTEEIAAEYAARATVPAEPEPWHPVPSCACGCWDNFNEAARPVPAAEPRCANCGAEAHPETPHVFDVPYVDDGAVPAADDRERLLALFDAIADGIDELQDEHPNDPAIRAIANRARECYRLLAGVSPSTGDASLREAAQRVSDKASVIARGGASPRWVVDDATFSALRAVLGSPSTGDADRLHEAIRAVYYEDKHPDLSGGLTTDPADARLAAAILRRLG
jgi:hypothetical protein